MYLCSCRFMPRSRSVWCFWAKRYARLIFRLSFAATVRADRSLFGDKASPGDGRSRGDDPEFEDGVTTCISLIGVLAEASKKNSKLDVVKEFSAEESR